MEHVLLLIDKNATDVSFFHHVATQFLPKMRFTVCSASRGCIAYDETLFVPHRPLSQFFIDHCLVAEEHSADNYEIWLKRPFAEGYRSLDALVYRIAEVFSNDWEQWIWLSSLPRQRSERLGQAILKKKINPEFFEEVLLPLLCFWTRETPERVLSMTMAYVSYLFHNVFMDDTRKLCTYIESRQSGCTFYRRKINKPSNGFGIELDPRQIKSISCSTSSMKCRAVMEDNQVETFDRVVCFADDLNMFRNLFTLMENNELFQTIFTSASVPFFAHHSTDIVFHDRTLPKYTQHPQMLVDVDLAKNETIVASFFQTDRGMNRAFSMTNDPMVDGVKRQSQLSAEWALVFSEALETWKDACGGNPIVLFAGPSVFGMDYEMRFLGCLAILAHLFPDQPFRPDVWVEHWDHPSMGSVDRDLSWLTERTSIVTAIPSLWMQKTSWMSRWWSTVSNVLSSLYSRAKRILCCVPCRY